MNVCRSRCNQKDHLKINIAEVTCTGREERWGVKSKPYLYIKFQSQKKFTFTCGVYIKFTKIQNKVAPSVLSVSKLQNYLKIKENRKSIYIKASVSFREGGLLRVCIQIYNSFSRASKLLRPLQMIHKKIITRAQYKDG